MQECTPKEIADWLSLSESESVVAEDSFRNLQALQEPWIPGYGQKNGNWHRKISEIMQSETLGMGRVFFTNLLLHIRDRRMKLNTNNIAGAQAQDRVFEHIIQQWQVLDENCSVKLEQQLLLKEFRIGRRFQDLPTWTGIVSVPHTSIDLGNSLVSPVDDRSKRGFRDSCPFDVFISHTWDKDDEGRGNHARAKQLNESLRRLGFKTWFDDERMRGNSLHNIAKGIEGSAVFLICVTRRYMEKVAEDADNNCKFEFEYALIKGTVLNMLPVVMEDSMLDTSKWHRSLGMTLRRRQYYKLTTNDDSDFDDAVDAIALQIRESIEHQKRVAFEFISRSESPMRSTLSGIDTVPELPREHNVVTMYIDSQVYQFRNDMKQNLQSFLTDNRGHSSRKWRLCELLLVAFMRNLVAPCVAMIAENLEVWQGWCEDPDINLINSFDELMQMLKPPIFHELNYNFPKTSKQNHSSIFVINWMVRDSEWALPLGKRDAWDEEVVRQWFEPDNKEDSCDCLLERAETFLQKGVKGISWGAKILGKAIRTE